MELVERLKEYRVSAPPEFPVHPLICDGAIDKIERLTLIQKENSMKRERLWAALQLVADSTMELGIANLRLAQEVENLRKELENGDLDKSIREDSEN